MIRRTLTRNTLTMTLIGLVLILALPVFAQGTQDESTAEPRLSYTVCNWGLLTIEHPSTRPVIFVTIDSPVEYSAIPGAAFTVSGTGAGLFEGNVVVEVSSEGELLFSEPTVLRAEEMGAVGEWSMDVDLGELEESTRLFIRAYSPLGDGLRTVWDAIEVNANSDFGLPFVELTHPFASESISVSPLRIEGVAGGAFENNIVIEVRDFATRTLLTETFATIATDELGGSGAFAAEVDLDLPSGTPITVVAYHPAIADDEEVTVINTQVGVVNPLARTYDRFLTIGPNDPLYLADYALFCGAASSEFENEEIAPLEITDVQVVATRSTTPLVTVSIEAVKSSNCPLPLRTRIVREGNTFDITLYYDVTTPAPCTADLVPFIQRVSLGTLETTDYTIMVNGRTAE